MGLGIAYKDGRPVNKSIYQFKKVLDHQPDNVVALNNIGLIHLQKGQYDSAISLYNKVVAG